MSKIMDADPVAVDGISKKPNSWFQFVGRVRALTGLAQPDAMRLASELRAEKAIDTWTDAEVAPRGIKWLRQNYMVMTEQTLKAKIDAIAALKEKAVEIDAMAAEIAEFKKREFITPKSNPLMVAAIGKFAEYCEKIVPKQLSDAAEELFKTAAQEDSYDTAMEIPVTIREKMLEIMSLDKKLAEKAKKATNPTLLSTMGSDIPDASEYRVPAADIDESVCVGRILKGGEDRRWSPIIYREHQCRGAVEEGSDLCATCARREQKYGETGRVGDWEGRITEEPLDESHMLGTAWAETKKLRFLGVEIVVAQASKKEKIAANVKNSTGGKKKEAAAVPSPLIAAAAATAAAGAGVEEPALSMEDARRKGVPKHIKTLVWNKYVGAAVNSTKCMCCREELISIRSFHCGHVKAASKGGDCTINNLRPICAACNGSMGTMSMNEFTMTYFGWEV